MLAIGFLSRREHSRQELRAKLLAALRKRAREEADLAEVAERTARDIAQALLATPSNGIDDAFAPPMPPSSSPSARDGARLPGRGAPPAKTTRRAPGAAPLLDAVRLASGHALPSHLRASLAAAAAAAEADVDAHADAVRGVVSRADRNGPPGGTGDGWTPTLEGDVDTGADTGIGADADGEPGDDLEDPEAVVDRLLDWLVANKYIDEQRFVESRVNARARKQGAMLIKQELSRHGLALEPEQAATLRQTEFARAQAIWQRKFGAQGVDARARAKQARFLAARGFASDVVRRVIGGEEDF